MKRVLYIIIALILIIAIYLGVKYQFHYETDELYLEKRSYHNSFYSEEKELESNLIVTITNQSFSNKRVKIKGFVDEEKLFNDTFDVYDQHQVTYYYKTIQPGLHTIRFISEDDTEYIEEINMKEDKIYLFVSYWGNKEEGSRIDVRFDNKPFGID